MIDREEWGFESEAEQAERAYRKEMDTLRWTGEAIQLPPLPRRPQSGVILMSPRAITQIRQTEQQEADARDDARYHAE